MGQLETQALALLRKRCGGAAQQVLPHYVRLLRTLMAMKPKVSWKRVAQATGRTEQYLSQVRLGKSTLTLRDFLHQALLFGHDAATLAQVLRDGADPIAGVTDLQPVDSRTLAKEVDRWVDGLRRYCTDRAILVTQAPVQLGWDDSAPSETLSRWWARSAKNPDFPRLIQLLVWKGDDLGDLMHFVYPPLAQQAAASAG